jgi:hypothetical protein
MYLNSVRCAIHPVENASYPAPFLRMSGRVAHRHHDIELMNIIIAIKHV